MKNFFKNIFGRKMNQIESNISKENFAAPSLENIIEPTRDVPAELFVDNNSPIEESKSEEIVSETKLFLESNHRESGFADGYQYHSSEIMNSTVNSNASKFRKLMDDEIEKAKSEIVNFRHHFSRVGESFPEILKSLQIGISQKEELIEQFKEQKTLSVEFEGWISHPVNSYKLGFRQGLEAYLEEAGLLTKFQNS